MGSFTLSSPVGSEHEVARQRGGGADKDAHAHLRGQEYGHSPDSDTFSFLRDVTRLQTYHEWV